MGAGKPTPPVSTEPLALWLVARPLGTSGWTEPRPDVRRDTCCGGLSQSVSHPECSHIPDLMKRAVSGGGSRGLRSAERPSPGQWGPRAVHLPAGRAGAQPGWAGVCAAPRRPPPAQPSQTRSLLWAGGGRWGSCWEDPSKPSAASPGVTARLVEDSLLVARELVSTRLQCSDDADPLIGTNQTRCRG